MSHIHIPDGVLPVWLWVSGYILTAVLVAGLWRRGEPTADARRFALLGVFAAIMILVMSIEIPPFSYHFNLSVVTGIVLGPQLAVLAAFVVDLMLALVGHGGVTVVGLNTLVLSTEMLVGYYVFRLLSQKAHRRIRRRAFAATFVGLACGTGLAYGIIAAGSRWIDRILQSPTAEHIELRHLMAGPHLDLGRLAIIMFGVGFIGWILESVVSAAILVYMDKIYPGILERTD